MTLHPHPLLGALGIAAALFAGNVQAQATTGSLAGWSVLGDAVSSGGAITLTTAFLDGAGDQAGNLSGTSAADAFDVATAAGLNITALDIGGQFATEGSLAKQSFSVTAGQQVSFSWSFASQDTLFLDNAFVVVGGQLYHLATTGAPGLATQRSAYTFTTSGTTTLAFGVVDTNDVDGVSRLTISGLQVSGVTAPVPEPQTYALMLAGLGLVGVAATRRRNKAGF